MELLCSSCRKVRIDVTRDKAVYIVKCDKEPRVRGGQGWGGAQDMWLRPETGGKAQGWG